MARPVAGIQASIEPVSWGPWRDRPSALAPAALVEALQRAGWTAVMLAPTPDRELLRMLDALVMFGGSAELDGLRATAAELGLAIVVLGTPVDGGVDDFAREVAALTP